MQVWWALWWGNLTRLGLLVVSSSPSIAQVLGAGSGGLELHGPTFPCAAHLPGCLKDSRKVWLERKPVQWLPTQCLVSGLEHLTRT